jgi:hypothetical protein
MLDQIVRYLNQRRLVAVLLSGFLPGLVVGSTIVNVAEVTVENAKSIGFEVSVFTSTTIPKTHARIEYPATAEAVWAAARVEIIYSDTNHRKRFVQYIDLDGKGRQPIKFLFDKQDGESNVAAVFTYSCIDENIRCDGWANRQYYIASIASFEVDQ